MAQHNLISLFVRNNTIVGSNHYTERRVQQELEPIEADQLGITWYNGTVYRFHSEDQMVAFVAAQGIKPYVPLTEEEYLAQHVTPYL